MTTTRQQVQVVLDRCALPNKANVRQHKTNLHVGTPMEGETREHPLRTFPREGEGVTTMGTHGDSGRGVKVNKDVPFKY